MGESFDHRPAGWIRQSRKRCIQLIHNHMVVNYPSMSSVDFGGRITGKSGTEPLPLEWPDLTGATRAAILCAS